MAFLQNGVLLCWDLKKSKGLEGPMELFSQAGRGGHQIERRLSDAEPDAKIHFHHSLL